MENARQLEVNLYPRAPGMSVSLEVLRGAEKRTFVVTVAERAGDPSRFADRVSPQKNAVERLGILGLDLDDELAALLPSLRARAGVLVATSDLRSGVGLAPGDVIYSVNQQSVKGVESLREALARLGPETPLVLQIERGSELRFLQVELEP